MKISFQLILDFIHARLWRLMRIIFGGFFEKKHLEKFWRVQHPFGTHFEINRIQGWKDRPGVSCWGQCECPMVKLYYPPNHPGRCRCVVFLLPNSGGGLDLFRCCHLKRLVPLFNPDRPHSGLSLVENLHHILHVVDALQHRLAADQVTLVQGGQMRHKVPVNTIISLKLLKPLSRSWTCTS